MTKYRLTASAKHWIQLLPASTGTAPSLTHTFVGIVLYGIYLQLQTDTIRREMVIGRSKNQS